MRERTPDRRPRLRKKLARPRRRPHRPLAFSALEQGDLDMIRLLLAQKPDLAHERDLSGVTLLLAAALRGLDAFVDLLLPTAGPLDACEAAALDRADRLAELLEAGEAAPDDESPEGFTLLQIACFLGRESAAALLLDRGARIEKRSSHPMGVRAVHAAAAGRNPDLVRRLLERGADVFAPQAGGWTLLHHAAHQGDAALARHLLERGAASGATTDRGQTPADVARAFGHEALASELE